jgi:hypothetical protein
MRSMAFCRDTKTCEGRSIMRNGQEDELGVETQEQATAHVKHDHEEELVEEWEDESFPASDPPSNY